MMKNNTLFSKSTLPSGKELTVFELKGWHFFKTSAKMNELIEQNKYNKDFEKPDYMKILISISVHIDGVAPSLDELDNISFADISYISEVMSLQCKSLTDF